jgi:filamentous hemagglutinin
MRVRSLQRVKKAQEGLQNDGIFGVCVIFHHFGMGVTAQTVPLTGGVSAITGGKIATTAGVGFVLGASLEYGINPDASLASMVVSGTGSAVGGAVKLGLNATFGLANQWIPSTVANVGTWVAGSQVAGRATKGGLNQVGDTTADTSWWTTPIATCGFLPRKPC